MAINVEILASDEIMRLLMRLGGIKRVAAEFGLTTQAVSNWIVRGIPDARQADLLALIARTEAEGGPPIAWRPRGWDPRVKVSFDPDCNIAA